MTSYIFEFVGTLVLILMGDGVCASNTLKHSKGQGGGWIVITLAWGFAVMCGVLIAGPVSGAHLNPAVTLGLAVAGSFPWSDVLGYIVAQMLGGFVGALLVYVFYRDHYKATEDPAAVLGTFCTMPAIKHLGQNFLCEVIGTCVLVFLILALATPGNAGLVGVFPVTCVIMAIGMSLGGATGYAINPARDLSPRLAHALIFRRDSGWWYSWVPVAGPMVGAVLAALLYLALY